MMRIATTMIYRCGRRSLLPDRSMDVVRDSLGWHPVRFSIRMRTTAPTWGISSLFLFQFDQLPFQLGPHHL
ncbi:MAG: hypothetical protein ACYC6H_05450, partial [Bellilinea sp.]